MILLPTFQNRVPICSYLQRHTSEQRQVASRVGLLTESQRFATPHRYSIFCFIEPHWVLKRFLAPGDPLRRLLGANQHDLARFTQQHISQDRLLHKAYDFAGKPSIIQNLLEWKTE